MTKRRSSTTIAPISTTSGDIISSTYNSGPDYHSSETQPNTRSVKMASKYGTEDIRVSTARSREHEETRKLNEKLRKLDWWT